MIKEKKKSLQHKYCGRKASLYMEVMNKLEPQIHKSWLFHSLPQEFADKVIKLTTSNSHIATLRRTAVCLLCAELRYNQGFHLIWTVRVKIL